MNAEEKDFAEADAALSAAISNSKQNSIAEATSITPYVTARSSYSETDTNRYTHFVEYLITCSFGLAFEIRLTHPMITFPQGLEGDNTGRLLWPCAGVLSSWMSRNFEEYFIRQDKEYKSVVEICAGGCGLPGLALGCIMATARKGAS